MIPVTPTISIDESELDEDFVRASGPGGQNVNKVATAVQLRFDARSSPSLPDDVRLRLLRLAGRQITADGVLVIRASNYRTQERNRQEAVRRLVELVRAAAIPPVERRPTRATAASRARRLESKRRRGAIKNGRRHGAAPED